MKFNLSKPCSSCPFLRTKAGFFMEERARDILDSLWRGESFPCHSTLVYDLDDGEGRATKKTEQCAGAEILLARSGRSTQLVRIAERCGVEVAVLDMDADVYQDADEMLEASS